MIGEAEPSTDDPAYRIYCYNDKKQKTKLVMLKSEFRSMVLKNLANPAELEWSELKSRDGGN